MKHHTPQEAEALITRHSIKGEGSAYSELSPEGVEKAKKRAEELVLLIEQAEPGSVIFLGGNSYEERTRSTLRAYSDKLKEILQQHPDVLLFDPEQIKEELKKGHLAAARSLQEKADQYPEAKIVIDLPLQLKDFSRKEWWYDPEGNVRPEADALIRKHGKDSSSAIKEWFGHGGIIDGEQKMANPREMAESYLNGIRRLEDFVKRFSRNRKIKIIIVGHSFEIDALLTYLANNGTISSEGFDKIGGEVIDTTELAVIEPDNEGNLHLRYRGQKFALETLSGEKTSSP